MNKVNFRRAWQGIRPMGTGDCGCVEWMCVPCIVQGRRNPLSWPARIRNMWSAFWERPQ